MALIGGALIEGALVRGSRRAEDEAVGPEPVGLLERFEIASEGRGERVVRRPAPLGEHPQPLRVRPAVDVPVSALTRRGRREVDPAFGQARQGRHELEEYPGEEPPVAIEDSVPKIVGSRGAWLLARLGDGCTLVEYVTRGEPGGVIGALQFLAASRTLRDTVEGMVEMTRDHLEEPHPTVRFVRPDGTPLDEDPAG